MAAKKAKKPRVPKQQGDKPKHVVSDGVKAGQRFEAIQKLEALRDRKIADAPRALTALFDKKIERVLAELTPKQRKLAQQMRGIVETEHADTEPPPPASQEAAQ